MNINVRVGPLPNENSHASSKITLKEMNHA